MRNFEERKAEIFRRSEKRIKERKKVRNRLIAVGIPLCLIVAVWSATVLPAILPVTKGAAGTTDAITEDADDMIPVLKAYTQVEIQNTNNPQNCEKLANEAEVGAIYELVEAFYQLSETQVSVGTSNSATKGDALADTNYANPSYLIRFTDENGNKADYKLDGVTLKNESSGVIITLTEEQLAELKSKFSVF